MSKLRRLRSAELMISKEEAEAAKSLSEHEFFWDGLKSLFREAGVPREILEGMLKTSPARSFPAIYKELSSPAKPLIDGDRISIGGYSFLTILTAGHSPGHICLYEPEKKLLLAGDHLLPSITPHVAWWGRDDDPLSEYLDSLEKIRTLNVDLILPGHEKPFKNHSKRIEELKNHHISRAAEITSELQRQSMTPYQIATKISWDIEYPSFHRFPAFQKYLAVGETLAHLRFLEERKLVRKNEKTETVIYYAD